MPTPAPLPKTNGFSIISPKANGQAVSSSSSSSSNSNSNNSSNAEPVATFYNLNGANGAVQPVNAPATAPSNNRSTTNHAESIFLREDVSASASTSSASLSATSNNPLPQNSTARNTFTASSSTGIPNGSSSTSTARAQNLTLQSDGLRNRKTVDPLIPSPHKTLPFAGYEAYSTPTDATPKSIFYQHTSTTGFPRISRPVELMRDSYDVVVIGSGYGGGVAASRMARSGKSVCLLERGKERWPGEFPTTPIKAAELLHVSGLREPLLGLGNGKVLEDTGDPTELYHLILGEGQNVFVGNGLGGTSLLNANVFLPATHRTLELDRWPQEIRDNPSCLDEYYERAKSVLEPRKYPENYPSLPKLELLKKQAKLLGFSDRFDRVLQTTRFEDGPNSTGVQMHASKLTGQDSTGLNDGSKSSTLVNYLSDAWNWGAEMFCQAEVRYVKRHPEGKGYLIFFAWHGSHRGAFKERLHEDYMWVHAKECVFFGAGALGTTEILLRSKAMGLPIGGEIGTQMSGNGDILSFGYNTDEQVNAIGRENPDATRPVGPTITGIIDCRDQPDTRDGYVIEEGAVPSALAHLMDPIIGISKDKDSSPATIHSTFMERMKQLGARATSLTLGPYYANGSLERTQVYLIMSHDSNQAILKLDGNQPVLRFSGVGRQERVKELHKVLQQATEAVNGTYVDSPFYASLGQQQITVHPIGGAVMSRDGTGSNGVTNQYGQIFKGRGTEVYEGLVCVDASVIPTALGANPFATITALAERSLEHIAAQFNAKTDLVTRNGPLDLFGTPQRSTLPESDRMKSIETMMLKAKADHRQGFAFSEVMSGFIHIGPEITEYELAASTAKGLCEAARFFLNVRSWDIDDMVSSPSHRSLLTGSFACGLRGSPFMINQGDFSLLTNDRATSDTKNLTYDFDMTSIYGEKVHFHGYKVVNTAVAFDPFAYWRATTTLYVTLTNPKDHSLLGRGILHIRAKDLLPELASMAPSAYSFLGRVAATGKFLSYFVKQSAGLFFAPLAWQQYPSPSYHGFKSSIRPDHQCEVRASDGVRSVVKMWNPTGVDVNQKKVPTILMIGGAAVDDTIFSLPTVKTNAVTYFRQHGYRLYTVCHRIGKSPANESTNPTTFDARLDIAAAVEFVTQQLGGEKFYIIAHCMGSVALSMGLLEGSIPTTHIKGITASQTFMNPKWAALNMLKTKAPIALDGLYQRLAGSWYPISSSRDDFYVQQAINQMLRLYPVGGRKELCRNVACHRCSFVFGRCWNHENLNRQTHDQIDRFFGGVNMNFLHHAMHFGSVAYATGPEPVNARLDTPNNLERLRGIPIFLFSGSDNAVLTPESTDITFSRLSDFFPDGDYNRHVIKDYGHLDCWMGKNAAHDIFPIVRRHIDRIMLNLDQPISATAYE